MGITTAAEDLVGPDELEEFFRLDASESSPEEDENDEDEDDDENQEDDGNDKGVKPEGMPHD